MRGRFRKVSVLANFIPNIMWMWIVWSNLCVCVCVCVLLLSCNATEHAVYIFHISHIAHHTITVHILSYFHCCWCGFVFHSLLITLNVCSTCIHYYRWQLKQCSESLSAMFHLMDEWGEKCAWNKWKRTNWGKFAFYKLRMTWMDFMQFFQLFTTSNPVAFPNLYFVPNHTYHKHI